jgi:hypothetical protein
MTTFLTEFNLAQVEGTIMPVISLSTIPPRMHKIESTLESLLNQSAEIDEIRVNIPKRYRRFEFAPSDIPTLPKGVRAALVEEDYGPATKVLPTVSELADTQVKILFCDDDHIYPRDWAATLIQASHEKPGCCIALRGHDLDNQTDWTGTLKRDLLPRGGQRRKDLKYRLQRSLSLGLHKPSFYFSGYVDMLIGHWGALITPEMIPEEAFGIPEHLWIVDDPWLSGHLTRNGVPIWLQAKHGLRPRSNAVVSRTEALLNLSHQGRSRSVSNMECVLYFQTKYDMYQGIKPQESVPTNRLSATV